MAWFKRKDKKLKDPEKKTIPDGLWDKCPSCNEIIYKPELEKKLSVCHHCNHHFRILPDSYVSLLLDEGTFASYFDNLMPKDFLDFKANKGYQDQINVAKTKTGENDEVITIILFLEDLLTNQINPFDNRFDARDQYYYC